MESMARLLIFILLVAGCSALRFRTNLPRHLWSSLRKRIREPLHSVVDDKQQQQQQEQQQQQQEERQVRKSSWLSGEGDYDGTFDDDGWGGHMDGFDWELEKARRLLEGPAFAPLRMTLWQPDFDSLGGREGSAPRQPPGFFDQAKILINNAMQIVGVAESIDGAPMVQGVNTFKGSFIQLLARVVDGDLQELAGGPLFLLLADYYKKYGPVYKLAFGPKSFIVVSDPTMVKHILKDNPQNYDKGILAEILEPVMGKGLIPADPETWKVRRKAIVPGFHKAWLNAMVRLFLRLTAENCLFC